MDRYVLLLSHGNLAKEIYNTAELIFGEIVNMGFQTLPAGTDLLSYKQSIIKVVNEHEKTLIVTDLFGGSPFMISTQVFGDQLYNDKVEIVTGMNLAMVLELASKLRNDEKDELNKIAKEAGEFGIVDLREKLMEEDNNEYQNDKN